MTSVNYLEEIQNFVFHENRIVTYKWLSRRLGTHVNKAKQMLFEFMVLASKESVHAVYCLCGVSDGKRHTVKLVFQEDLEEIRKTFKILTSIHIYSIESCRPKDAFALAMVNREISKSIPRNTVGDPGDVEDKKEDAPSLEQTINNQKTMSMDLDLDVDLDVDVDVDVDVSVDAGVDVNAGEYVNANVDVNVDADVGVDVNAEPIMDTRVESKEFNRSYSLISDSMDIDQDQSLKQISKKSPESSESPESPESPRRKRGKRKVLRKKTYKNARGFLVSEDVYEWESFSEEELSPKKGVTNENSKRVKLESPSGKNGANKRTKKKGEELSSQKSLLNFFGKA